MPNITQFENQINGLRPDDSAYSARIQEGRHIEASYQSVASSINSVGQEWEKHVTLQQQMTGLRQSTELTAHLTDQWNQKYADDAAADVHNPHLHDEFMKQVGDTLDTYDKNFSTDQGQAWWAERKAQLSQHFREVTAADVSHLAGIQAAQDADRSYNSSVAASFDSPSSLQINLGTIDSTEKLSITALGANASPQAVALLKEHAEQNRRLAVLNAAHGMINQAAPGQEQTAADAILHTQAADQYLTGEDRQTITKTAEAQANVNKEKDRAAQLQQKEQLETEGKAYFAQIRASMLDANGNLHTSPELVDAAKKGALKYGSVLPGEVDSTISAIREAHDREVNHENVDTNWDAFDKLAAGAMNGGVTQKDIDGAYVARQLSNTEYSHLTGMLDRVGKDPNEKEMQKRLSAFIDSEKRQVLGAFPARASPASHQAYFAFDSAIRSAVESARARGLTPQQIMDTALNPGDKAHYFGYDQGIMGRIMHIATPTKAGAQAAVAQQHAGGGLLPPPSKTFQANHPAPRLQGESPAAYLARTGG